MYLATFYYLIRCQRSNATDSVVSLGNSYEMVQGVTGVIVVLLVIWFPKLLDLEDIELKRINNSQLRISFEIYQMW